MINLEITQEEKELFVEYLDRNIDDLHSEITHTSDRDYKEDLKKQRDVLRNILQQLQG